MGVFVILDDRDNDFVEPWFHQPSIVRVAAAALGNHNDEQTGYPGADRGMGTGGRRGVGARSRDRGRGGSQRGQRQPGV